MLPELRGCNKSLHKGGPQFYKSLLSFKPLHGKETLLADIVEEEIAHQTQVSVLSHLHLGQAEEIRKLPTLQERQ